MAEGAGERVKPPVPRRGNLGRTYFGYLNFPKQLVDVSCASWRITIELPLCHSLVRLVRYAANIQHLTFNIQCSKKAPS